jgi:hypothetical protein
VDVEGCERLSVHGGLLDVAWFCVCASWGTNVLLVVVVGESASALGDRRFCVEGV